MLDHTVRGLAERAHAMHANITYVHAVHQDMYGKNVKLECYSLKNTYSSMVLLQLTPITPINA